MKNVLILLLAINLFVCVALIRGKALGQAIEPVYVLTTFCLAIFLGGCLFWLIRKNHN